MQQLDEHRVTTQAMQFSAFKQPFEERIASWDINYLISKIDQWLMVVKLVILQPIFDSVDIMKQLPMEGKKLMVLIVYGVKQWKIVKIKCFIFADNQPLRLNLKKQQSF